MAMAFQVASGAQRLILAITAPFHSLSTFLNQKAQSAYLWIGLGLMLFVIGGLSPLIYKPFNQVWLAPLLVGACLAVTARANGAWARLALSLAFGISFYGAPAYWITFSLIDYSPLPASWAWIGPIGAGLGGAFYLALALAFYQPHKWGWVSGLRLAGLWGFSELLRGFHWTGVPLFTLGQAFTDTALNHLMPWIGSLGVGLLVVLFSSYLALFSLSSLLAAAGLLIAGLAFVPSYLPKYSGQIASLGLITATNPIEERYNTTSLQKRVSTYGRLIRSINDPVSAVLFPETAISSFQLTSALKAAHQILEANPKVESLAAGFITPSAKKHANSFHNSILLVDREHPKTYQAYYKTKLVPLGEWVPTGFGWLGKALNIPMSAIKPGENPRPYLKNDAQQFAMIPAICYETLYPWLIRDHLIKTPLPSFLYLPSDDSWYQSPIQNAQLHQIAQARALEAGRYVLRVVQGGPSVLITPGGALQESFPPGGAYRVEVPLIQDQTPYTLGAASIALLLSFLLWLDILYHRLGPWFGWRRKNRAQGHPIKNMDVF